MKRHYCSINTLNKERGKRMFCKNCGKENSDGSQVCKFCGQNLTSSVTENSIEPMVNTKKKENKDSNYQCNCNFSFVSWRWFVFYV